MFCKRPGFGRNVVSRIVRLILQSPYDMAYSVKLPLSDPRLFTLVASGSINIVKKSDHNIPNRRTNKHKKYKQLKDAEEGVRTRGINPQLVQLIQFNKLRKLYARTLYYFKITSPKNVDQNLTAQNV